MRASSKASIFRENTQIKSINTGGRHEGGAQETSEDYLARFHYLPEETREHVAVKAIHLPTIIDNIRSENPQIAIDKTHAHHDIARHGCSQVLSMDE